MALNFHAGIIDRSLTLGRFREGKGEGAISIDSSSQNILSFTTNIGRIDRSLEVMGCHMDVIRVYTVLNGDIQKGGRRDGLSHGCY